MRTLANWLNEMQRIQEDYGHELAEIGRLSGDFEILTPRGMMMNNSTTNTNFADLNALQLFAHVRWLNPPTNGAAAEIPHLNCAFFVFHMAVVVLERRMKQQENNQVHINQFNLKI